MYNQEKCKFLKSHEWAFVDGSEAVTGISDHAQHEIGDIVFVELPKVGTKLEAGKRAGVIESVKSASDIYAPVSGEVTAVNTAVSADPGAINKDPHGAGWLYKIKIADKKEIDALLTFEQYKDTLK
ncbi:MAG: glycine cleavage system protein GcvH [Elusimicrobia bacterium]|nr:glycine cleavage system protein GcvH [Elusimicrobiota bacterium]